VLDWDGEVSRLHAELECVGGEWTVMDDGLSHNGTFVNGERVRGRRRLRDGDALRFGRTVVAFLAPADSESKVTAAAGAGAGPERLTDAQRRVLVALSRPFRRSSHASPATNAQIAEELSLSVDAVKAHLRALYGRFGIEDLPQNQKRAQLVWQAFQAGLITTRDLVD
jgi:hypothetical protein